MQVGGTHPNTLVPDAFGPTDTKRFSLDYSRVPRGTGGAVPAAPGADAGGALAAPGADSGRRAAAPPGAKDPGLTRITPLKGAATSGLRSDCTASGAHGPAGR